MRILAWCAKQIRSFLQTHTTHMNDSKNKCGVKSCNSCLDDDDDNNNILTIPTTPHIFIYLSNSYPPYEYNKHTQRSRYLVFISFNVHMETNTHTHTDNKHKLHIYLKLIKYFYLNG